MSQSSRDQDNDQARRPSRSVDPQEQEEEPDSRDLDRNDYVATVASNSGSKFTPFPDLIAVQSFVSNDSDQPSSTQPNLAHNAQSTGNGCDSSASIRHVPDISIISGRPSYKASFINFDSLNAPSPSSSSIVGSSASPSSSTSFASGPSFSSSASATVFAAQPSSSSVSYSGIHNRPSSSSSISYAPSSSSASSSFVSSSRSATVASSSHHNSHPAVHCSPASSVASSSSVHCGSSNQEVSASGLPSDTALVLHSALTSLQQSVDRVYRSIHQRLSEVESKLDNVTDEIRRAQNDRDLAPHAQAADSIRDELQQFQRDQRQAWDREKRDMLRMFAQLFRNASDQMNDDEQPQY